MELILDFHAAHRTYRTGGRVVPALAGVDLQVRPGESVALVGESGAGKSTLARAALGLEPLDAGQVRLAGQDVSRAPARRAAWRQAQLLHQDARAHVGVGMRVGALVAESARIHRPTEPPQAVAEAALAAVGLADRADADPGVLSGGELRRLGLARVLCARPALLIADEPTTGLDGPRAWEVARLLRHGPMAPAALLLVTHDLRLARAICDRIVVMAGGRVVERVPGDALCTGPHHPHTEALLAAAGLMPRRGAPRVEPRPGPGCTLRGACAWARPACGAPVPLVEHAAGHEIACPAVP